jgi:leucyl-tRNA synthetase
MAPAGAPSAGLDERVLRRERRIDFRPMSAPSPTRADDAPPHRYTAALAASIERAWQERWQREGTFRAPNPGDAGFDASRPKFYVLDMFPYPSGSGLHVGHPEGYTATDIVARHKRMKGFNVLHPMGWDAFGLPAEQYAVQTGVHPSITTREAIETFRRQLQRFGFSYDWSREIATIDPDYYRWTQWIFLQIYNAWYDPSAEGGRGKARPIAGLVTAMESGRHGIGPSGELVDLTGKPGGVGGPPLALAGEPVGVRMWHELSQEERRAFIDGHRLAYLAEQTVNWCPKLGTVLANEEVHDGRSERGGFPVYRRSLKQWMFRITVYAERLIDDLALVQWPESTRTMQVEWIGRSEGAQVDFPLADQDVAGAGGGSIRVYTTRPDTIFGATFMVLAPEHPLVESILAAPPAGADSAAIRAYIESARNKADVDRLAEGKDKTGVFSGLYAVNPANGAEIPVWIADYVLMGYGHGAIMAVPAHDERDSEFARRFGLPIREVVRLPTGAAPAAGEAFSGTGVAINSDNEQVSLDGLPTDQAKVRIIEWLERTGAGRRKVNYKLRDWLFSRQRYWGEPFPIVYDERGDHYPVRDAALPVTLPDLKEFKPPESEDPQPMLAAARGWLRTTAGAAGVDPALLPRETPVYREANTMPNWAGSCWYYLRFADARNPARFVGEQAETYWMDRTGVDLYIGGAEHAVLHLLYARFWHKVLFDLGYVSMPEPMKRLFHQGLITSYAYQKADRSLVAADQVEEVTEGRYELKETREPVTQVVAKMSKSLKNVINPDDVIAEYGADTMRLYEMYMGPLEASKPWNPRDITGQSRFLQKAWRTLIDEQTGLPRLADKPDEKVERELHRTIARIGPQIDELRFNTAIADLIKFINTVPAGGGGAAGAALTRSQAERFLLILAPFAPHLAEEAWSRLGHAKSLAYEAWPAYDEAMLRDAEVQIPVQINGKVRGHVMVPAGADAKTTEAAALADARVQALVEGKPVKKVIVVPGKLVNVVV